MEEIESEAIPSTPYPYSQAILDGDRVYVSGQIGADPESGEVAGDVGEQAAQTLDNIGKILEAAGTSLDNVLKTTAYLVNEDDFEAFNDAYAERMTEPYPARSTVITGLAADVGIEIDVIAKVP